VGSAEASPAMRALVFLIAIPAVAVGVVWPAAMGAAILVALVAAFVAGAALGDRGRSTPPTITRIPTRYEQRRWGWGLGFAIGFHGAFPFIYIHRRF